MFDKLVDLIVEFLKAFRICTIIHPYQKGVLSRLGRFHHILEPGLRFFFPFLIDQLIVEDVVTEMLKVGPQSLTTKDGKEVVISTIVTFQIEDVKTFLLEVEGRNQVINDSTIGITSDFIMSHSWQELHDELDLSKELTRVVRRQAKKYGVGILSVQLADLSRCRSLRLVGMGGLLSHPPSQP